RGRIATRLLAWVAIVSAVALAVLLVAITVRNVVSAAVVVAGFAMSVAGAWWLVTEHPPRRWIGVGGVVVGLGLLVGAVVNAVSSSESPVLRLALAIGLFVVMTGSARLAIVQALHDEDA